MRYYAIKIHDAPSMFPAISGAKLDGAQWCSVISDQNDPGAQQVDFELEEAYFPERGANNSVTIKGIPFEQITEQANLVGKGVEVWGGMFPGLPLATFQSQYMNGPLMTGVISRCWGSWVGPDMSLGFNILPGPMTSVGTGGAGKPGEGQIGGFGGTNPTQETGGGAATMSRQPRYRGVGPRGIGRGASVGALDFGSAIGSALGGIVSSVFGQGGGTLNLGDALASLVGGGGSVGNPVNIIHNLMPNMPMSAAIMQTLKTAFPNAKINMNISPNLKLPSQDAGMYQSLPQFAAYIKEQTQAILGGNYQGVKISTHGPSIDVWDETKPSGTVHIDFRDLIGQPVWINPNVAMVKTIMRSDIHIGDWIALPPGLMQVTEASGLTWGAEGMGMPAGPLAFQGEFQVQDVRHYGDFRHPDGNAWCTVITVNIAEAGSGAANLAGPAAVSGVGPKGQETIPSTSSSAMRRSVRRYP
jgi:hypothetical protein